MRKSLRGLPELMEGRFNTIFSFNIEFVNSNSNQISFFIKNLIKQWFNYFHFLFNTLKNPYTFPLIHFSNSFWSESHFPLSSCFKYINNAFRDLRKLDCNTNPSFFITSNTQWFFTFCALLLLSKKILLFQFWKNWWNLSKIYFKVYVK